MRVRILSRLALAALLGTGMGVAQAANLGFLHDTPASYMKQKDNESLGRAVRAALDDKQDGESANWTNEGTGNSIKIDATITPGNTVKDDKGTCRDATVALNAKGQTMMLRPRYCRTQGTAWIYQKTH